MSTLRILEAQYVDLSDDELKNVIGSLHENIKRLIESKKTDDEINALKSQVRELEHTRYTHQISVFGKRLKAARRLATLRGITFHLERIDEPQE